MTTAVGMSWLCLVSPEFFFEETKTDFLTSCTVPSTTLICLGESEVVLASH